MVLPLASVMLKPSNAEMTDSPEAASLD